jgi:hypothetical protein
MRVWAKIITCGASLATGPFMFSRLVDLIRQINKWYMQVKGRKMQVGVWIRQVEGEEMQVRGGEEEITGNLKGRKDI